MAPSRLAKRLARIRSLSAEMCPAVPGNGLDDAGSPSAEPDACAAPETDGEGVPDGTESVPFPLASRGWRNAGNGLFERTLRVGFPDFPAVLPVSLSLFFPREGNVSSPNIVPRLRFFDLETTGLSHGAGTVAFMASVGSIDADGVFRLTQLILPDYPFEAALLERVAALMDCGGTEDESAVLVSFNGKCFDSQILKTRYLLNGIRPPRVFSGMSVAEDAAHLDLVHPCRRLWRGCLGSCRLSDIEAGVLGTPRVDDLPGSEAPDAWFAWLRRQDADRLALIGEHNGEDCVSLVRILERLSRVAEAPADEELLDWGSAGCLYLTAGRRTGVSEYLETGERLLRRAGGKGKPALVLAAWLRRTRRRDESVELLRPLASDGSPEALRMLAVDAEYRLKDYPLALEYALLVTPSGGDAAAANRRVERLRLRLERS